MEIIVIALGVFTTILAGWVGLGAGRGRRARTFRDRRARPLFLQLCSWATEADTGFPSCQPPSVRDRRALGHAERR